MHETFIILRSFDLLEQPIKVSSDVEKREDAHVFSLWELLQVEIRIEDFSIYILNSTLIILV